MTTATTTSLPPPIVPVLPPTEPDSDQDPVDEESDTGHDGVPYIPAQDELPASSFSYHPLPPAQDSDDDDEEDQLRTDDEDDDDMPSASNEPSTRATSPAYGSHGKKTNKKGRAYLPFTQEQKGRFMDFLVQNPQVWAHATPEPGWVSWELQHQGKDTTWKKLAVVPGVSSPPCLQGLATDFSIRSRWTITPTSRGGNTIAPEQRESTPKRSACD